MSNIDLPTLYAEFESREFPQASTIWEHAGLTVASNAGGHAIVLAESEEFWDDDDGSAATAAWEVLKPLYRDYVIAATAAWGAPQAVDIRQRLARGESSPFTELLLDKGTFTGDFWDHGECALGLAICQHDKETAIEVVVLVVAARDL